MTSFATQLPFGRFAGSSRAAARRGVGLLFLWQERARQRTHLREILEGGEAHRLADMGMDRMAARREAEKFFWRA